MQEKYIAKTLSNMAMYKKKTTGNRPGLFPILYKNNCQKSQYIQYDIITVN